MKLTVIPTDNTIILNGRVLVFSFSAPANLHAIQWDGVKGTVETTDYKQTIISDATLVQPYIDAFNAEAALRDAPKPPKPPKTPAELEKEASDAAKAKLTQLRADTYPDVLAFLATLSGAPKAIKDAATAAVLEKAKVK